MARFYKQKFQSTNNKDEFIEQYVWDTDVTNNNFSVFPKDFNGDYMVPFTENINTANYIVLSKMTKEQIRSERLQRSSDHFRREVEPTLNNRNF